MNGWITALAIVVGGCDVMCCRDGTNWGAGGETHVIWLTDGQAFLDGMGHKYARARSVCLSHTTQYT